MNGENDIICRQEQRFDSFVRWGIILVTVIVGVIFLLRRKTLPIVAMWPFLLFAIFAYMFWVAKLQTQVRKDGLYVRLFPFHIRFKKFTFEEISEYYARKYSPLAEYLGWGIKGFGDDKAYNVSGNLGLQLVLKNGKKLLIGSQKPEELVAAIDSVMKNNSSRP